MFNSDLVRSKRNSALVRKRDSEFAVDRHWCGQISRRRNPVIYEEVVHFLWLIARAFTNTGTSATFIEMFRFVPSAGIEPEIGKYALRIIDT